MSLFDIWIAHELFERVLLRIVVFVESSTTIANVFPSHVLFMIRIPSFSPESQIARSLQSQALLVSGTALSVLRGTAAPFEFQGLAEVTGTRFTVIGPDGSVRADTSEDPAKMENHGC